MSITKHEELIGMQKASEAVAYTLKEMRNYAKPGMTTKQLDNFGAKILSDFGAKSATLLSQHRAGGSHRPMHASRSTDCRIYGALYTMDRNPCITMKFVDKGYLFLL